jgi:hypothetical protein
MGYDSPPQGASVALAVLWTPWIALTVLGLPILIRQAIRVVDRANDLLIDALLIGKVNARRARHKRPPLDFLDRARRTAAGRLDDRAGSS